MADAHDRILKILQTVTRSQTVPTIDPSESLFDSGLLDSFALPELVSALEAEFGLKIPDRDLTAQTFESVDRIASYIQQHS
jgi:acyl carrier protein